MTTTQAQIAAARRYLQTNGCSISDGLIGGALTAAAEVCSVTVGDHKDLAMVENLRDEVASLKDERAATIERCAQRLEQFYINSEGKIHDADALDDYIAAIRALKDKT